MKCCNCGSLMDLQQSADGDWLCPACIKIDTLCQQIDQVMMEVENEVSTGDL